jgi:hypothetical protein
MSRERLANAFDAAAEALAQLALELRGTDSPVARAGVGSEVEGATATPPPSSASDPLTTVLGQCPDHQTAWTVKAGGISKNGKPYPAFWRCNERTDGEYCQKRPTPAWDKSHPIQLVPA